MDIFRTVVIEIILNGEITAINFEKDSKNKKKFASEENVSLTIQLEEGICTSVSIDKISSELNELKDEVSMEFINKYNELVARYYSSVENGVEDSNEGQNDFEIKVPYDPNSIRVTQARFSLKEIYEMINGTEEEVAILDIAPDFQRNFVWDYTRKARLIESIMLKIPLPVFYLARDFEGKFQVVDGVQRLTVVDQFFSNKFKLKNLEYLNQECEGCYMKKSNGNSLHPKFYRALRSYQIDCNIIEPDTPYKVKLDIFKRLNTGGRSLNRQEIRHSIMSKNIRTYIKKLSDSDEFKMATDNSVKPKRMMDQELVLRYIGFYIFYIIKDDEYKLVYEGNMDIFLDEVVDLLNKDHEQLPLIEIAKKFKESMELANNMFGEYAFRKVRGKYKEENRNMINKSLFTAFAVLLTQYNSSGYAVNVLQKFAEYLGMNNYLYESITYGTNDTIRIDTAFLEIEKFLKGVMEGTNDKRNKN